MWSRGLIKSLILHPEELLEGISFHTVIKIMQQKNLTKFRNLDLVALMFNSRIFSKPSYGMADRFYWLEQQLLEFNRTLVPAPVSCQSSQQSPELAPLFTKY